MCWTNSFYERVFQNICLPNTVMLLTLLQSANLFSASSVSRTIIRLSTRQAVTPLLVRFLNLAEMPRVSCPLCQLSIPLNTFLLGISRDRWIHHTSFLWDFEASSMAYLSHPSKTPLYRDGRSQLDFLCRVWDYVSPSARADGKVPTNSEEAAALFCHYLSHHLCHMTIPITSGDGTRWHHLHQQ
jgi:hypothetical protein